MMMNPKQYFYRFLFLTLTPIIGPFILFYIQPSWFYYRAWEYHEDLGFKDPVLSTWVGHETGDMSRTHFFYYQEGKETTVTTDQYGFRSNRFKDQS